MSVRREEEAVWFSSHKTFPRDSLLVAGTVLCAEDSERNKIKLSSLGYFGCSPLREGEE